MRLLRTGPYEPGCEKFELVEKFGSQIPKYAILSHTWGDEEVTYEQVRAPTAFERAVYSNKDEVIYENVRDQSVRECKAYSKVVGAMRQAASDGHEYIWIDTCCIDKSSSAELSEAINSMYAWYEKAEVCYAVLDGVPGPDSEDFEADFKASRWFTRGWTLQELLAPQDVVFFGRPLAGSWIMLGDQKSLRLLISTCTRIPMKYLTNPKALEHASIAQKMSWVARRETTREEDIAYCLLGLFTVNMPLLYGEGPRAFMRLQEEIMKNSADQSIFAWMHDPAGDASECGFEQPVTCERLRNSERCKFQIRGEPEIPNYWPDTSHGLLADSPKAFLESGQVISLSIPPRDQIPYHMTNRGLSISLNIKPMSKDPQETLYLAAIGCYLWPALDRKRYYDEMSPICVYLESQTTTSVNRFARIRCEKLALIAREDALHAESANSMAVFIRQSDTLWNRSW